MIPSRLLPMLIVREPKLAAAVVVQFWRAELEWELEDGRLHFEPGDGKLHYEPEDGKIHYEVR